MKIRSTSKAETILNLAPATDLNGRIARSPKARSITGWYLFRPGVNRTE